MKAEGLELTDILEGGYLCYRKERKFIDDVIRENIKYILKREKIIDDNAEIIIPPGAYFEISTDGFYSVDFSIYDGNNIKGKGNASGSCVITLANDPCDDYMELLNMTVDVEVE